MLPLMASTTPNRTLVRMFEVFCGVTRLEREVFVDNGAAACRVFTDQNAQHLREIVFEMPASTYDCSLQNKRPRESEFTRPWVGFVRFMDTADISTDRSAS